LEKVDGGDAVFLFVFFLRQSRTCPISAARFFTKSRKMVENG
jgi:hypothetical protein